MGMADDNQKKFNQETINKQKTQTQYREGTKGNKLKTEEERVGRESGKERVGCSHLYSNCANFINEQQAELCRQLCTYVRQLIINSA